MCVYVYRIGIISVIVGVCYPVWATLYNIIYTQEFKHSNLAH